MTACSALLRCSILLSDEITSVYCSAPHNVPFLFLAALKVAVTSQSDTNHPDLTFIEPVGQAVEDHSLFPRGDQADGSALHRRSVVDVVFKYEDLERGERRPIVSLSIAPLASPPTFHFAAVPGCDSHPLFSLCAAFLQIHLWLPIAARLHLNPYRSTDTRCCSPLSQHLP